MYKLALSLTLIYLITTIPVVYQQCRHHLEFSFKFFGKLSKKGYNTILSAEGSTYGDALKKCSTFCSGDQRCIGLELCQIKDDSFRCRVCCGWKIIRSNHVDEQPGCKYLQMDQEHRENLAAIASLSTIFVQYGVPLHASNAVDGNTKCIKLTQIAHSREEQNPWLRIGLKRDASVREVLLYNRQDLLGDRLHNVSVTVTGYGVDYSCGLFPGPAATGDLVLFMCENGVTGVNVTIQILSENGPLNNLSVCEVELFD